MILFLFERYLDELYILHLNTSATIWSKPKTHGQPPSPRESHTANIYIPKGEGANSSDASLVIYGGMDGARLGDVHILKLGECLVYGIYM